MRLGKKQVPKQDNLMEVSLAGLGITSSTQLVGIYRKQQTSWEVHRIRYYAQDDGYAYKIIDLMTNHLVGTNGVQVDFGTDRLNNLWKEWRPNPQFPEQCFDEILRFMVLTLIRDGESILQMAWDGDGFYTMPVDIIDLPLDNTRVLEGPNMMLQTITNSGIEFDRLRRPVRYHFRPELGKQPYTLPADEVVHTFVTRYAGQTRGLSWFLGALDTMAELNEFERNIARAVKNASADPGVYKVPNRLFPGLTPADFQADSAGEGRGTRAARLLEQMVNLSPDKRGLIPEDVDFVSTHLGNVFQGQIAQSYRQAALGRIAACVGLSYASVSGDLEHANYSSLQQGQVQDRALYRRAQAILLQAIRQVVQKWLWWQGMKSFRMEAACKNCEPMFLLPPFETIDRVKDAQANKILKELEVVSPSTLIQGMGQDPETVFRQIAEDKATMQKYLKEFGVEEEEEEKPTSNSPAPRGGTPK